MAARRRINSLSLQWGLVQWGLVQWGMRAFAQQARLKRAWKAMMKVGLRKRRKLEVDLLSSSKVYFEEEGMCEGKERVSLRMGRAEWYG
jgi:hypothetical protein